MRKVYIFILIAASAAAFNVGCKKSVMDCNFVVKPLVQDTLGAAELPATGAYAYAFFADTTDWLPNTWANAEAGLLTARKSAETKKFDMKIELNDQGLLEIGPLTTMNVIIVVCDPVNRMFAWRQAELAENLEYIFIKARFKPWKTEKLFTESRWNMVSEFAPEPPPKPDPEPDPKPDPEPKPDPTPVP